MRPVAPIRGGGLPRVLLRCLATWLAVALVFVGIATVAAHADVSGDGPQYGVIGQYGEVWRGGGFDAAAYDGGNYDKPLTPGKFLDPVGFAVDTTDKTAGGDGTAVYVLDRTSNLPARVAGQTSWRLQKLDDRGKVLGTDRFTLPAGGHYELLGLAVDPNSGSIYSLVVTFNADVGEAVQEIIGWSTTPDGSGHLGRATGLAADSLAAGTAGFPTPGLLSSDAQLSSQGEPVIFSPQGLALDRTGQSSYLAVEGQDPTFAGLTGLTQVCAESSCGMAARGSVTRQWSSSVLRGLPNDAGDAGLPPAGISTAPDGSLIVLLDEQTGPAPSNIDVVQVPADLRSKPKILSSGVNAARNADFGSLADDDAAVFTQDAPVEISDPNGGTAATLLAAPQVIALSNGLYAAEFEPDPSGQPDPQNPSGGPGLWTDHDPGVRLLTPASDGTMSQPTAPLSSLFDTLGNPATNTTGTTASATACNLSDSVTAAAGVDASPFPSLQAGAGGALWVLTHGSDSAGTGFNRRGGRELIELAPRAGDPCPTPSGTFSVANGSGPPQLASTTAPLSVAAGATVNFDASTIAYQGGATAEYVWDFGDGDTITTLGSDSPPFQWPDPTATETYTKSGTYTVGLTVYGDFGVYTETGTIDVGTGSVPTAAVTYSPSNPNTSTAVGFDANGSAPSAGATIEDYLWDFGDGTIDDTAGPTDTHVYSNPGTYTVHLRIHDSRNGLSAPAAQTFTVVAAPPAPPAVTATGPTTSTTSTTPAATKPTAVVKAPVMRTDFAAHSTRQGTISVAVFCPADETSCSGSVALKTARRVVVAVTRSHGKRRVRRGVLALGASSFTIGGGKHKTIAIHLAAAGLALLRKQHTLAARATVGAVNPQGKRSVKTYRTTLRFPAAAKHRKSKR